MKVNAANCISRAFHKRKLLSRFPPVHENAGIATHARTPSHDAPIYCSALLSQSCRNDCVDPHCLHTLSKLKTHIRRLQLLCGDNVMANGHRIYSGKVAENVLWSEASEASTDTTESSADYSGECFNLAHVHYLTDLLLLDMATNKASRIFLSLLFECCGSPTMLLSVLLDY